MDRDTQTPLEQDPESTRPWGRIALIVIGFLVASGIVFAIYNITDSDDSAEVAATATTAESSTVSASDDDVTELPQNPSLRLFEEAGTIYVGNNGNVTMSGIEVRDGAGAAICDLGLISPGDRQACDGATAALAPISAVGSGPQGQAIETGLE